MNEQDARAMAHQLVDASPLAMFGTTDAEGYPNVRAMLKLENDGLKYLWFSTYTHANRTAQIRKNPKTCVYFMVPNKSAGLILTGRAEVLTDRESRARCWRDEFHRYYPGGLDDPDYAVIRFRVVKAKFYAGRKNVTFEP